LTSSALVDRLHANVVWGARGSFVASPMVGPQGDQRLGWGAELAGFARTAAFTFDVAAFLAKYAQDLQDGQLADGRFPDAAPGARQGSAGTPGWADAGVMVPALLHELYGDTRVLERQYAGMKKWVDGRAAAPKVADARPLGDPGAIGPQPSLAFVAQAYQVASARLLARSASTLGKPEDAARYGALADQAAAAFSAAFTTADGGLASDSATAYALALRFDLLAADARAPSLARLVAALERGEKHPPTGVLGTPHLLPALAAGGRAELAAAVLLGESAPSWLAAVKAGATTPWERWDALGPGGSDRSAPAAYDHLALASVGEWLYTGLAGLDFDRGAPPWSRMIIRPLVGAGGLTRVRGEHTSIRGKVVSDWRLGSDGLTLEIEVPVHATALLHVPAASADAIKEAGRPLAGSAAVRVVETHDGVVVLELGSGRYRFTVPRP
jgi:alpha-L-rhamnosidase